MKKGKALIFSAPSGAGKTTIVRYLIEQNPLLEFSISATTRPRRDTEIDGIDYYFLSTHEFQSKIAAGAFLEWEEVYKGNYYGTLRSELERIWDAGRYVIFDVDVEGGLTLKEELGDQALAVFVKVSDLDTLRRRLEFRQSESSSTLAVRLEKAADEMLYESRFDYVLINDDREQALAEAELVTKKFLD
ncbi:MAG: guanylate kinase [Bacteroidota bacterium]